MKTNLTSEGVGGALPGGAHPLAAPVLAGLTAWAVISLGFFGLKFLMQKRPEFVGPPISAVKAVLVQESPRWMARQVSDDVSVSKSLQPDSSDIRFAMHGRRDYRGLKTVSDMSGAFTARYVLTNAAEEAMFVLFRCPHPRTESGGGSALFAGGLRLQASVPGEQESAKDAWLWSGSLPARTSLSIEVAYEVASLSAVRYRIADDDRRPLKRVQVTFDRTDLDSMHFESGDGAMAVGSGPLMWDRKDFLGPDTFSASIVEGRNLFTALSQLAEIGPLISLLFLTAVLAILQARQRLTAVQTLTIAAGYGCYFPLILYLSSRFSFGVALALAVAIPGVLLLNYARWLVGKVGLVGGAILLALYQVFPTLAAFGGWNRGMVLLCLGVVTLAVLIQLQNRALRRRSMLAALILLLTVTSSPGAGAAQLQVVFPAELTNHLFGAESQKTAPWLNHEAAQYEIRHEATYFQIEARLAFEVVRSGEQPTLLLAAPVYLQTSRLESAMSNLVRLVTVTNRLGLLAERPGKGVLSLTYRVPVGHRDGKQRAEIPLLIVPSAQVRLESARGDLEITGGSVWSRRVAEQVTQYELGVAGEDTLAIEWIGQGRESLPGGMQHPADGAGGLYGIGLKRAQHLTVINSDGSCTHFAEFEMSVDQKEEFRIRFPAQAKLISASVNGVEVRAPVVDDSAFCRIPLPTTARGQAVHRLSFRLTAPSVRLGFLGTMELTLPEMFQTVGTLEWVVSLPDGFEIQVVSSGLDSPKGAADLSVFGDYSTILKSRPAMRLAKTLAPPGKAGANFRYRQIISGR